MAGNSNTDESVTGPVADPVLSDNQAAETTNDIVDVLQKSTATVSKIYSVLFSKSKAEFMQDLSENNRYVRDVMFVIMKRRKPSTQYGNLVERRATENIKDTLLKDIYSIFCYGEGSTNSLPKNLFKADCFLLSSGTQTGLCIDSPTATLADLNVLKTQLLQKVAELRNDFLNVSTSQCVSPTVVGNVVDLRPINSEQTGLAEVIRTRPMNPPTIDLSYVEDHEAVERTKSQKILVAGDSRYEVSSSLTLGCWNVQYLKTAQLYFKSLISCFDVLAISEHCLFEEQLDFFDKISNSSHNYTAVCSNDNPHLLSGKNAHGGVALLWKHTFDNFITPLKNINSDRIVGIRCDFPNCPLLFILGVYLPSASHDKTEYDEYFDHLWSLYDSLSIQGVVVALGDFNGDLGNSLGDKGKHAPNSRGLKLLELCSHFIFALLIF